MPVDREGTRTKVSFACSNNIKMHNTIQEENIKRHWLRPSSDVGLHGKIAPMPRRNEHSGSQRGSVARNLARLMRERRIDSQAELARMTGGAIAQPEISRILSGLTHDPGGEKVMALAKVFGVSMEEFYLGDDPVFGDQVDSSFAEFERSSAGQGLSGEEKLILRKMVLPLGPKISLTVWIQALAILRAVRQK